VFYLAESMRKQDSTAVADGQRAAVWAQGYAGLWLLVALAGTGLLDRLTSVLLVLSTFLFAIVVRYSRRYMMGHPRQGRFLFWLCLTSTLVFALVLAPNLPVFIAAWCGISLGLHQLLQFYADRPAALLAARKKFLVSRIGDLALLAALILIHQTFGTWNFEDILAAAAQLGVEGPGSVPSSIGWICSLLVFAALLKSAQFPFHSWLPDTMETPTPVSALMHAGIINAGGILVIRLSPLISLSDTAMVLLCVAGGVTALFASTVMLTQASVKRCLAFSTVAQMGFMMLECGLGAFHLALVHLVAHSLYKAHAFLSSGNAVQLRPKGSRLSNGLVPVLSSVLAGMALTFLAAKAMSVSPFDSLALNLIFSIALAQMLRASFFGSKVRLDDSTGADPRRRAGHCLLHSGRIGSTGREANWQPRDRNWRAFRPPFPLSRRRTIAVPADRAYPIRGEPLRSRQEWFLLQHPGQSTNGHALAAKTFEGENLNDSESGYASGTAGRSVD
jgi:NADH:ubiquinone oxidoreductase subunit 5 (subunit L)/multisubunit Na+/H+ antiporter MnhA subunit